MKREHAASTLRARHKGKRQGWNADPTANEAIKAIMNAEANDEAAQRYNDLMPKLKELIWESGFVLVERIKLQDVKTGKHFL